MEQTIGSRIKQLRKSRNMTQDQLAELVGVSPQAVSKWENDVSLPDISLLPRLAEIFQVTTDSLLGVPEKTEIVPMPVKVPAADWAAEEEEYLEAGDEDEEGHAGFTFQFDVNKSDLPWFATALLLFAVSLLLNRTLLAPLGEASVWALIWPSAMVALGLSSLWERISLWAAGVTGFGGYYLLVNLHILQRWKFLSWKIILPVLLVFWALSLFADHFSGKERHSGHEKPEARSNYQADNGGISYDGSFGSEHVVVTEPVFRGGDINVSFGDYTLDLTACGMVEPGSVLHVDASFGSLEVKLPRHWKLQEASDRSFSSVSTHGSPDDNADQLLLVESSLSFGHLDYRW